MRVQLAGYSEDWPKQFEEIRKRLHSALGSHAKRVEHIGSTAVPGLAAKPIIDILLQVDDLGDRAIGKALTGVGFALAVDEPDHRMFRSADAGVHIHAWQSGYPEIERHLLFRDWLRRHSGDRQLYEREKRRLAAMDWASQNDYAQAKSPIVREILDRARESNNPENNSPGMKIGDAHS
jgi:GrpB-like predicted nucleotidyltransferase (UPF0157 family)